MSLTVSIRKTIGENIRRARLSRRWTQNELSNRLKLSASNRVSEMEHGRHRFSETLLVNLSEVLGITPADLFKPYN